MKAALARMYPQSWRDRYGEEFEAMLEEQKTTLGTVTDVVLGAVDAHLTANAPENRGWWLRRLPGMLMAIGALIWAAGQGFNVARPWDQSDSLAVSVGVFGMALVGVASLAESSFRRGGSRLRWISSAVPATALLTLAAVLVIVWWGLLWVPQWVSPILWPSTILVIGAYLAQLAWALAMALMARVHRPAMAALAVAILLNFIVGHVVWSAAAAGTDTPLYPPDVDRFLAWLLPASWTLIGLSVLWPRRSPAAPRPEVDRTKER